MLPKDTRFLRLASARMDMAHSLEAFEVLRRTDPASPEFYCAAISMCVAYGRPFTENHGLGSLVVDYPSFPDFQDPDLNLRHHRLIDLRNNFMAHSSCVGTRLLILPAGSVNPATGETVNQPDHLVGKRTFGRIEFYDWLKDVVVALKGRLDNDVRQQLVRIANQLAEPMEMETGYDSFSWKVPHQS